MKNPELHRLFTELWGKAKDPDRYDRNEWIELERRIDNLEIACKEALDYLTKGPTLNPYNTVRARLSTALDGH